MKTKSLKEQHDFWKELPKEENKSVAFTDVFVIPKWELFAPTYSEAVEKVFTMLAKTRPFKNCYEGKVGPQYFRETEEKKKALAQFEGPYMEIPVQLGARWKGKSVDTVRTSYAPGEFGLGAFEIACILLTNPELLSSSNDLWIDCPGDDMSYGAAGSFPYAPYFDWSGGKVEFDSGSRDYADGRYGSASALVPAV